MNKLLMKKLGLAEGCTQEAYDAALLAHMEASEKLAASATTDEKLTHALKPVQASLEAAKAENAKLTGRLETLEKEKQAAAVDGVLTKYANKFPAAARDAMRDTVSAVGI